MEGWMESEAVVARDFMGRPRISRVVSASSEYVYLVGEAAFKIMQCGGEALPIGFPRADVYVIPPDFDPSKVEWERMKRWEAP
jgi:hypothetical protein